ncbi:N-acetylmuramoyl-L-alanine amidase family protein [Paenibacillus koleovorans]|uniref:N-acetylmuramoyl-L-alanine amidase family protein n=1 Tax=Paenibacillus koleovorans TaxID=121608 RepID=UPI000FDB603E|nr:N-acetylmuramoyl-L-alanine amidase [Paenibacillus koleovorans]
MKRSICAAFLVLCCSLLLLNPPASTAAERPSSKKEKIKPVPVERVPSWATTLTLPNTDVVIDVGHGGIDGGTSYGDLLEKDVNLQVGLKVFDLLIHSGVRTAINRTSDYAPSDDNDWLGSRSRHLRDLSQRKLLAEALRPKLVVSLHTNWAKRASRSGSTVLFQMNPQSHAAAHLIQHRLNGLYGKGEIPYLGKPFYLLNHSPCPAVIVEMGFISNASDREWLTQPAKQHKMAEAIASAIREYLIAFSSQPSKY